jgi:hypothetical protein
MSCRIDIQPQHHIGRRRQATPYDPSSSASVAGTIPTQHDLGPLSFDLEASGAGLFRQETLR